MWKRLLVVSAVSAAMSSMALAPGISFSVNVFIDDASVHGDAASAVKDWVH